MKRFSRCVRRDKLRRFLVPPRNRKKLAELRERLDHCQIRQRDLAKAQAAQPMKASNGADILSMPDKEELLQRGQTLKKVQRKSPSCVSEIKIFKPAPQGREAGYILEFVELQVQPPDIFEVPEEIKIAACDSIDVEFDVRPTVHERGRFLQFRRRQRLIELDDLTFRLERREPNRVN